MTPLPLIITLFLLLAAPPANAAEGWTWPVRGEVLTGYTNGDDPYAAGQHRGIDVGAPEGHPVVAAVGGTVTFAGSAGSSGLTVAVRTGDGRLDTSYLHLSATDVRRGDAVGAGERLGAVGVSGRRSADAPHLHFGVREADSEHGYLDPLDFLPPLVSPPAAPEPRPVPVGVPVPAEPLPDGVPVQVAPEPLPAPALFPLPLPSARTAPAPASMPLPVPGPLPLLGFEPAAAPRPAPEPLPGPQQAVGRSTPAGPVREPGTGSALGSAPSAARKAVSGRDAPRRPSAASHNAVPSERPADSPSTRARAARSTPSLDGSAREPAERSRLEAVHGGRIGPGEGVGTAPHARGETAGRPQIRFAEARPAVRPVSESPVDLGRVAAVAALLVAALAVGRPLARRAGRPRGGRGAAGGDAARRRSSSSRRSPERSVASPAPR